MTQSLQASSFFFFFSIFFFLPFTPCLGTPILPNTTLTPLSNPPSWTSSNGTFSMGFFSLQPNSYYVGIFYSSLPVNQSVVWSANRNASVSQNSILEFTSDGHLQLRNSPHGSIVWSALNSSSLVRANEAEMLDNGNFVLREGASSIVWESFNLPTDTLLPDQNFTAASPQLVPWSTSTDPTPSNRYSLVLESQGNLRLLSSQSFEYWSENSNGSAGVFYQTFRLNSTGSIALYDENGVLQWANFSCGSPSSIKKVRLDADGNLRVLAWSSNGHWNTLWRALYLQCSVGNACGDNGVCDFDKNKATVGGTGCPLVEPSEATICFCPAGFTRVEGNCLAESPINCSDKSMTTMDHTEFGDPLASSDYQLISQQACVNKCRDDCNCTAASYQDSTQECWLQRTDLPNGRRDTSYLRTSFVRTTPSAAATSIIPTAAPSPTHKDSSFPVYAIVLIAASASIGVVVFGVYLARSRVRRGSAYGHVAFPDMTERLGAPRRFSFQDLYLTTQGFSEGCKLGSGGFGGVYKGVFGLPESPDGKLEVAVKRLSSERQGDELDDGGSDFLAEVGILASIRHINVVNLLGYCAEGLLVYEYVANGSLDRHLFVASAAEKLDWQTRLQIALGAATGIEYLHTHCPKKIVHRDIKPANILVDEEFRAKVADFGISQIMDRERTHLTNYARGGTPTYMAPECWRIGAMVTVKADAYSFGMVLLELVSGKRVSKHQVNDNVKKRVLFFQDAMHFMEEERYQEFVDERLEGNYIAEELERLVRVAFWCLQGNPNQRPSMEDLLLMIKGHKVVPLPPLSGLTNFDTEDSNSVSSSSNLSLAFQSLPLSIAAMAEQVSEGR